jgi:hypothetical protein
MAKMRKTPARKLRRNPVARSLSAGQFRQKVVERPARPDRPPRKPKHRKPLGLDEDGE